MSGLEKGVRGIGAYPEWEYLLLAMTVFGRAMEDAHNGVSANAFVSPGLFREMNTLINAAIVVSPYKARNLKRRLHGRKHPLTHPRQE
jgi:hypothetical protein